MKHRSINQRLARAKSLDTKREILSDWSENWKAEQLTLVQRLEKAIGNDDFDELCIVVGQLKAVTDKRFLALPKIFSKLTEAEGNGE